MEHAEGYLLNVNGFGMSYYDEKPGEKFLPPCPTVGVIILRVRPRGRKLSFLRKVQAVLTIGIRRKE